MRQLRTLILSALVCAAATANAQTERLETLARVWAAVKFTHPAMLTRNVDWDGALVRAIPRVRTAATDAEFVAALDGMLHELGDTTTRIVDSVRETTFPDTPLIRRDGDVLIVSLGPAVDRNGYAVVQQGGRRIADEVGKSDAVVVDLSTASADTAAIVANFIDGADVWSAEPMTATQLWTTLYSGYAPQRGDSSGGYFSGLMLQAGQAMRGAKHAPKRLAFVTDGRLPLPASVVALWSAGKAAIISSAPVSNAAAVKRIPIGGGHDVQIRGGEFAIPSVSADLINPSPLVAAIDFVRGTTALQTHESTVPVPATHNLIEADYPEMIAPDLEHRLLACFRIWSTIAYFYPYKPLIGDWDAVLREFIPRFEQADGDVAYVKAVLEMTARVEDSHSGRIGHPSMTKVIANGFVPVGLRQIEGQPVVVEKLDPKVPLAVGDVIVSLDGEPFETRMTAMRKYIPAATDAARADRIMNLALHGAPGTIAHLGVRGADGVVRQVDVPRLASMPPQPDKGPAWRVLDGNIGYVDLTRLTVSEVDPMFDALMKTKAIIFDMRGYPLGTAWPIAPRINTRHATIAARFARPQIAGFDASDMTEATYAFEQPLPKSEKPLYTGKVVTLIDERAVSQAEHTCLFFEQAAGATFVGTPTAGANGDVTNYTLPGGFTVYFTGHEVRHADGRQLQRVGIQPDILVAPTIAGLRGGKDEVLDRAVAFLNGESGAIPSGIAAFNEALDHATRAMDNAATMALWADDGVSLLPSHAPIEGKKAIAAFIESVTSSMPAAHMETFEMQCHDVQVSGDWASEWCNEHQVVRFADGRPPFDGRGKMLLILHKNAAGQWQLREEMWNP